ncbi:MAG TPA: hypothetical protein VFD90_21045 [Gaiellales bacterium]|nr:hypothetical protein [Gaiellales bacterium]
MARRWLPVAAALAVSVLVAVVLAVHMTRRSDILEDVLAAPPTGNLAVENLSRAGTTLPVPRTTVRHAGDVALRISARDAAASDTAMTLQILGPGGRRLATCRYARGSFVDTTVLRCPIRDLSRVRRMRIIVDPLTRGLGVVGSKQGVASLIAPRSRSLAARLETILGRIGAKRPAPFSGWLVPIGTVLWLSGLLLVGLWIARPPRDEGDAPGR